MKLKTCLLLLLELFSITSTLGYIAENCGLGDKLAVQFLEFDFPTKIHLNDKQNTLKYSVTTRLTRELPKTLILKMEMRTPILGMWQRVPFCIDGFGTCQYKIQDEKFTNRKLKKILREFRTHNNVIKHVGVIPIQKLTKSTNLDPSLILGEYKVSVELKGIDKKDKLLACVEMKVNILP